MSRAKTNGNGAGKNGKDTALELIEGDDLLAFDDRPIETFPVPEWKRSVRVRPLGLDSVFALEALEKENAAPGVVTRFALRRGLVGADGEPCFTDAQIERLMAKKPEPVARIVQHILTISPKQQDALAPEGAAGK